MIAVKKFKNRYATLSSDKRKEQIRQAQSRLRAKRKKEGLKEQPFTLSKADHENMVMIKKVVTGVNSKNAAISYALSETVKNLTDDEVL
jgi:hypothetical protein